MAITYYKPDTTGIDPLCKRSGDIYTYFSSNMVIEFDSPAYYDGLTITNVNDGTVWRKDIDYVINVEDTTSESRARNLDASFVSRLVKSITLKAKVILPYQISLTYQTFYPVSPVSPISPTDGSVNFTPAVLKDMLTRLLSVEQKAMITGATSIPSDQVIPPLEEDIDCTNDKNIITELRSVNTFKGKNVIFPQQGSYFKDTLSISIDGVQLVKDTDYKAVCLDTYRTSITSNRSGVYHAIVIFKDYAGDNVSVTYHAVGGTPITADITRIQALISDILKYLNGTQYLTTDMLTSDPNIAALNSRLSILENTTMRALMQTPSYGRSSTGTTVARTLKSPDTGLHWWTVGSLYQVDNSTEVFTADTMKISIEMPDRHLRADLYLSVDINNTTQPLKISKENVLYDQGYIPYKTQTASVKPPMLFRIIYNETADNASGVLLQMGTAIPSLVERFAITDNSGVESAWYLALAASSDAAAPNDTSPITLPNSTRAWNTTGGQSASAVVTMPIDEGYLLFNGSVDFTTISAPTASSAVPFSTKVITPGWMPITQVESVDVYYSGSAGSGKVNIPVVYNLNKNIVMGQSAVTDFTLVEQSVGSLKFTTDGTNLTLFYTGTAPSANEVAINYVTLHTANTCSKLVTA